MKIPKTILTLILFTMPFNALATSGDCSSHGGVNCDIGPDIDGSVICNDGWANGSNLYLDVDMCGIDCSTYANSKISADQKISSAKSNLSTAQDNSSRCEGYIKAKLVSEGVPLESTSAQQIISNYIAECKSQVTYYQNLVNTYEAESEYYGNQYDTCQSDLVSLISKYNTIIENKKAILAEAQAELEAREKCVSVGNTYYSDGSCYCNPNYSWNSSKTACKLKENTSLDKFYIATSDEENNDLQDANQSQFSDAILSLKNKGIVSGYDDGTFKPFNTINRAEFTKIVMGATGLGISGSNCFSDVADEWFAPYVCSAKENGIISGYSDGTFKPNNTVNVAEALKIVLNAFNANVGQVSSGEAWYQPFVDYAEENELYLNTFDSTSKSMTREEMAEIVYRLIK